MRQILNFLKKFSSAQMTFFDRISVIFPFHKMFLNIILKINSGVLYGHQFEFVSYFLVYKLICQCILVYKYVSAKKFVLMLSICFFLALCKEICVFDRNGFKIKKIELN